MYLDEDHGALYGTVTNVWDPNYVRISEFETDLVVDKNVRFGSTTTLEMPAPSWSGLTQKPPPWICYFFDIYKNAP